MEYNAYQYGARERIWVCAQGALISLAICLLFYDSLWVALVGAVPGGVIFLRVGKYGRIRKRRQELVNEFRDLMEAMMAALSAGYSIENALWEARRDMSLLYEKESLIMLELQDMCKRLELSYSVEDLFLSLGERSGAEDIQVFAEVLLTARKSGGNLVKIMGQTSKNISEKIEIRNEIDTMITGKKLESRCMMVIPLLIILYLQMFSPGFLGPLYHNLLGALIMTGFLGVYGVGVWLAKKIMTIEF